MDADLNDLRYFALTVQQGGFSAAERHARITKSKLSRRVALLEARLGVRLLQRSTRRLALTEAGRAFYEHCAAMLVEAEAAENAIDQLRSEPSGTVRFTCPASMAQFYVARILAKYVRKYPKVRVEFEASDRAVNLLEERFDVALRVRESGQNPDLVVRRVGSARLILVAGVDHPAAQQDIGDPLALAKLDTIGTLIDGPEQTWPLVASDGRTLLVRHRPRLLCSDYTAQFEAVTAGAGIALLPLRIAWRGLKNDRMVHLARDWGTAETGIHLLYVSKRGMLPSVRSLVDYLVEQIPLALAE